MGKFKNRSYDIAEQLIDNVIEKIIKDEVGLDDAIEELIENNIVSAFFSRHEIESIISHELKKEVYYGGECEH